MNFKIAKLKIKTIPNSPGIYNFIDSSGTILYVGKAKDLKSRIKSYFLSSLDRGPAIEKMIEMAKKIKIIKTESEIEAIFLEAELIKKLKPKYNSALKDDKSFNYIRISNSRPRTRADNSAQCGVSQPREKELQYPSVTLVRSREIETDEKAKKVAQFFGPYPAGLALKKSIRYLRRIFQFRDCSISKYSTATKKHRVCLYGDIAICSAPCMARISSQEYRKNISYFRKFLRGKKKEIIKDLEHDMKRASKSGNFELAAHYRDQILALNHLHEVAVGLRDDSFESSKILFNRIECYDISNIMGEYAVGAMSVIVNGRADNSEYRKFKIRTVKSANDLAMLEETLKRRFKNNWPKPDLLIIDGGVNQLNITKKIIGNIKLNIPVVSIAKGAKRDKNELHFSNQDVAQYIKKTPAAEKLIILARNEAHRFAVQYYRLLHKKSMLS